jgi:hypothetical protein
MMLCGTTPAPLRSCLPSALWQTARFKQSPDGILQRFDERGQKMGTAVRLSGVRSNLRMNLLFVIVH